MSRGYALWYLVIGILTLLSSIAIIGRTEALKRLMDSTVAKDSGAMAGIFGLALLTFLGGSLVDFVKDYLRSRLDQDSTMKLQDLDRYVRQRLRQWLRSRKGTRGRWSEKAFVAVLGRSGLESFYVSGTCGLRP